MATWLRRGDGYLVRWKELFVTVDEDGAQKREWKDRGRTVRTKVDADAMVAEVQRLQGLGLRWEDQREKAVVTLGVIRTKYNEAAVGKPESTQRWRKALMNAWIAFAKEETPATYMSLELLEKYAATLPAKGRGAATRHRKVLEVERMWRWAAERPDSLPGVPPPRKITGDDASSVKAPPPVIRTATPTWDDLDRMIEMLAPGAVRPVKKSTDEQEALRKRKTEQRKEYATERKTAYRVGDLHQRVALFLRYTGVRISQALTLRWDDIDLDHVTPYVRIRAGRRGAKASRGRVIPLHPALVRDLAGRGRREGLVFDPGDMAGKTWAEGEACRTAFKSAWEAAGVDVAKWAVAPAEKEAGERAHGSPSHAFRACVKTGLLRAGVPESLADYYIGHSKGATHAAYVPEDAPETSPLWAALVDAVNKIPEYRKS